MCNVQRLEPNVIPSLLAFAGDPVPRVRVVRSVGVRSVLSLFACLLSLVGSFFVSNDDIGCIACACDAALPRLCAARRSTGSGDRGSARRGRAGAHRGDAIAVVFDSRHWQRLMLT